MSTEDIRLKLSLEYQRFVGYPLNQGFNFGSGKDAIEAYSRAMIFLCLRGLSLMKDRNLPNSEDRPDDATLLAYIGEQWPEIRKSLNLSDVDKKEVDKRFNELSTAKTCSHCNLPYERLRFCMQCKTVKYCSERCQEKDWPKHKKKCFSVVAGTYKPRRKNVIENIS